MKFMAGAVRFFYIAVYGLYKPYISWVQGPGNSKGSICMYTVYSM